MLYPSLSQTFYQAFKLYTQSFLEVLWFLLLIALSHMALDRFFPQQSVVNASFFYRIFLDMSLSALGFTFVVYTLYQKQRSKPCNIIYVITKSSQRFMTMLIAYLLISTPLLLTLYLQSIANLSRLPPVLQQLPLLIALIGTVIIVTYAFLAGMFIMVENQSAVRGLMKSARLVHDYWVDTLLVVLMYGMIAIGLSMFLQDLNVSYGVAILTFFTSSFYPALMVIHFETLKKCELNNDSNRGMLIKACSK